jgi:cyclopropane fatty-acyl-phospholipid synthase-like methyltransferase
MTLRRIGVAFLSITLIAAWTMTGSAQLASRPAEEWIKTLDGPARIASLKIDEVVAALKLQPGQIVADIGAGTGLLSVPIARGVGPTGRVYAVEIDKGFFPEIARRAAAAQVTNVQTVLGTFTDPSLPVKNVDLALFHDVMHHVAGRAEYLKTLAGYLAADGRIAVVDFEGGQGPHAKEPELQAPRDQLVAMMKDAGLTPVEDVKLFTDKYYLVFAKKGGRLTPGVAHSPDRYSPPAVRE